MSLVRSRDRTTFGFGSDLRDSPRGFGSLGSWLRSSFILPSLFFPLFRLFLFFFVFFSSSLGSHSILKNTVCSCCFLIEHPCLAIDTRITHLLSLHIRNNALFSGCNFHAWTCNESGLDCHRGAPPLPLQLHFALERPTCSHGEEGYSPQILTQLLPDTEPHTSVTTLTLNTLISLPGQDPPALLRAKKRDPQVFVHFFMVGPLFLSSERMLRVVLFVLGVVSIP